MTCLRSTSASSRSTFQVKKTTGFYPRPSVDANGKSAVGQAGGVLLTSTVRAAGLDVGLSAVLGPWRPVGATHDPAKVLPLLYLHGLSSGDFGPALAQFLGTSAGLSASVITRLTAQWQDEAKAFAARDLSGVDYVYMWADGIHVGVRLEQERLCLLVLIGVRTDGRKELITLADGFRESEGSWADLLRDAARRGMRRAAGPPTVSYTH